MIDVMEAHEDFDKFRHMMRKERSSPRALA